MFNSEFNEFALRPEIDIRPAELVAEIDKLNDWMYNSVNNGVYRCGFARSQEACKLQLSYTAQPYLFFPFL